MWHRNKLSKLKLQLKAPLPYCALTLAPLAIAHPDYSLLECCTPEKGHSVIIKMQGANEDKWEFTAFECQTLTNLGLWC